MDKGVWTDIVSVFRFGYVTFDSTETATRAKEALNNSIFEGRRLVVEYSVHRARPRPKMPVTRTLFVGNMSFDLTDKDLNDLFADIANVIDVRVAVDKRTGQPRGFAHAEFTDTESAQVAHEILSQKSPFGRKLRVDYSYTNKRGPAGQNRYGAPPVEPQ